MSDPAQPVVIIPEAPQLTAAMALLESLGDRLDDLARDSESTSEVARLTRLATLAQAADDATFQVLNIASAYLGCTASKLAIARHNARNSGLEVTQR